MLQSGTPYKTLVHLAAAKLTGKDAGSLPKLFENDPLDEESRLVMLALMGSRLALQTGSFTALLPEMVASHLMVSMRVGDDHEPLEAFYPSEPILAEASSNITAAYGWTKPCHAMFALFRHGMVEKGFREEYVTKALCCIAFEDACRELKEKAGQEEGSEEIILWYSRPVPVFLFLDRLLRNPLRKVEIDAELLTDDDDVDDDGGSSTSNLSSPPEGTISPISGRRNRRRLTHIPKVVGGQTQKSDNIAGKRKRVNDDTSEGSRESKMPRKAPNKAGQKPAKPTYDDPICEPTDDFFDDWESDEEDFPDFEDDDTVPGAREEEEPGFHQYILKTLSEWYNHRRQTKRATKTGADGVSAYGRCLRDINVLEGGKVFLTHWISIDTKLRPSILLKAWNRGAGIITKANTEGIDLVIPVMLKPDSDNNSFGPLFGPWTIEQEKAASRTVSYILLHAKNDALLSDNDIKIQARKCAPSASNFRSHAPMNPFVTIIARYATSNLDMPVKLVRDATLDTEPHQLSLSAQGLSGATFKCLEGRPDLTRILKVILEMDHNPLRGSAWQDYEGFRNTTRDYYHVATHPGREFNLFGTIDSPTFTTDIH